MESEKKEDFMGNISSHHEFRQIEIPCIGFTSPVFTLVDPQVQYYTKTILSRTSDTKKVVTQILNLKS